MKAWHARNKESQKLKRAEWRATRGQSEEQKVKARARSNWCYASKKLPAELLPPKPARVLLPVEERKRRDRASNARWVAANQDYLKERARAYSQRPEVRPRMAAYQRAYTQAPENKERIKASKARYLARPEVKAAQRPNLGAFHVRWRQQNPERAAALNANIQHRRRARKRASAVGPVDLLALRRAHLGLCGICQLPLGLREPHHVDHIVPIARGGAHVQSNLQLAHPRCNRKKGAKIG